MCPAMSATGSPCVCFNSNTVRWSSGNASNAFARCSIASSRLTRPLGLVWSAASQRSRRHELSANLEQRQPGSREHVAVLVLISPPRELEQEVVVQIGDHRGRDHRSPQLPLLKPGAPQSSSFLAAISNRQTTKEGHA